MKSLRLHILGLLGVICLVLAGGGHAVAQQMPTAPAGADPVGALVDQTGGPQAPGTASPADQAYILGPEDVVELEVLGRSDFKTRARIAQDGTILLPYIGQVHAADRTTQDLAAEVTRMLEAAAIFSNPILRVDVVSYASRYVTVLGAVASPGLVPINKAYRLSEILARVGGVAGNSADYVVVRPENGAEHRYSIKALTTGDISQDPFVSPSDKIFVPTAEIFYISGQVRSPGQYAIAPDMTLRMAIARAGGLTELGSDKRIKINRQGEKLRRFDLDDFVRPGDVIDVGERLF